MSVIFDIVVVFIIGVSTFLGYKRGLVKVAANLVSFILAIIISALLLFLIIFHKKIVVNGLKTLLLILLIFIILGLSTFSLKIKPAEKLVGYTCPKTLFHIS